MVATAVKRGAVVGVLVALAGVAAAAALFAKHQYDAFLSTALSLPEEGEILMVERGDNVTTVVRKLEALGVTRHDWRWRLLARREAASIQTGEYLLTAPLRPGDLLDMLRSGRVLQHRFTLVEGWTWAQLLAALAADPVLEHTVDASLHAAEIEVVAAQIGAPELGHAEGWFLPETYYFVRGERDIDILGRAHAAMRNALQEAWDGRAIGLPIDTPDQLLIMASIIEKETALEEERNRISGVLNRRLQRGMRLQVDPTVIYGLGENFDGDIRRRDLRNDTPYNTYTRHGLPPTPIAMPGRRSLMAAAQPDDGDALYFVANGDGGHTFSATLEAHEEAVRKLIERQ